MASSTIRKAIGVVKDQTSIFLARVSSKIAPDLDVAIVRATSHDDEPADEKHIREILNLASYSQGYANECVSTISRRLGKTRDWIVALKTIMLVHRLLAEGVPTIQNELFFATRRGTLLLNMSDFRDEAHSSSWDHSAFVRAYALYLDQRLECMLCDHNPSSGGGNGSFHSPREQQRSQLSYPYGNNSNSNVLPLLGEEMRPATPLREMKPEKVMDLMNQLQQLFDRFLACRPIGLAKNSRLIITSLCPLVRESFELYAHICEILAVLLDRYFDMEYAECVLSFEAYASAAKLIDELNAFYGWCKDTGVAKSSAYPEVQRITDKLLETLKEFMRDRITRTNSPPRRLERVLTVQDMNSIKALPSPSDYEEQQVAEVLKQEPRHQIQPQPQRDLVDLSEDAGTADSQGNKLALALFSDEPAGNTNCTWKVFLSSEGSGEGVVTSAWQKPTAEDEIADWELALVEAASKLAKQKTAMGGGFDPLLLNGMYDHGAVRQHVSAHASIGSVSSVILPGRGKTVRPVLALPTSGGAVQKIVADPFAASLSIPPPSYVQMSDIEKKQQLMMQEQQLWHHYNHGGMQGQASLAKPNNAHYYPN